MRDAHLIWMEDKNGGYWYCDMCGAIYRKPHYWIPEAEYCMRCHCHWDLSLEEEKDNGYVDGN